MHEFTQASSYINLSAVDSQSSTQVPWNIYLFIVDLQSSTQVPSNIYLFIVALQFSTQVPSNIYLLLALQSFKHSWLITYLFKRLQFSFVIQTLGFVGSSKLSAGH